MPVFLTLGEVTFANNEIPERINGGGDQALAVHQLVGGQRVVDSMGRMDDDISWSGLFFGSSATFRARFLDGMRVQGTVLPFSYSQFNYLVKVRSFRFSFERFNQIRYDISLTVIQDLNQPFPILVPVAYNDAILELVTEAQDLANAIANPSIESAIAVMAYTTNQVASLSDASSIAVAAVLVPVNAAQEVVGSSISALSGQIFGGSSFLSTSAASITEPNDELADDLNQLSEMYTLQNVLVQIQKNLTLITEGAAGQTITVNGGSLFQLAAKYYGDATQWTTLARANNLVDPELPAGTPLSLVIPPQSTDTGGIYTS